jgi:hypothetical protein
MAKIQHHPFRGDWQYLSQLCFKAQQNRKISQRFKLLCRKPVFMNWQLLCYFEEKFHHDHNKIV